MSKPENETLISCVKKEFSEKAKDFFDIAELRIINMALENVAFTGEDSARLYLRTIDKINFLMEKNEGIRDSKAMPSSSK